MTAAAFRQARRAEALGARLPPLLVAAQRVAATVAQGVHGRRRVGQGDSFWQYRPFLPGDAYSRIDWRASAKSDRSFIRETEWEAAQTVFLWRDGSPSMDWRSGAAVPFKRERADLLLLALASLLLRGGERVRLIGGPAAAARRAVRAWRISPTGLRACAAAAACRRRSPLPRHARVVLIGDFLAPLDEIRRVGGRRSRRSRSSGICCRCSTRRKRCCPTPAGSGSRGWSTRPTRWCRGWRASAAATPRRSTAQLQGLAELCTAAGWGFGTHRTDHAPESALLAALPGARAR